MYVRVVGVGVYIFNVEKTLKNGILTENFNSAVAAEYENGVFVDVLLRGRVGCSYVMFRKKTHLIDRAAMLFRIIQDA